MWRMIVCSFLLVCCSTFAAKSSKAIKLTSQVTCAAKMPKLCLLSEQSPDKVIIYVENQHYFPLTVDLPFNHTRNMRIERVQPLSQTYHGRSKTLAAVLHRIDAKKSTGWSNRFLWQRGAMGVIHDDKFVYQLPYEVGKAFEVTQGFNGRFTHKDSNFYAIDFKMPIGTQVFAARGGVVVALKQDSNMGGANKRFRHDANYIAIRHDDGSLGEYFHLKKGGVVVALGQVVSRGQHIGFSGNTGFSGAPHLHFSVHSAISGAKRLSHFIQFQTVNGVEVLKRGKRYTNVLTN